MKLEIDLTKELLNHHSIDDKEKRVSLSKKHKVYESKLEKRRLNKWKKIEKKPPENHTNSSKTTDNSANSYSTESRQQEEGSDYNEETMSLRNEDKNTTMAPNPMKRLNNITDNGNRNRNVEFMLTLHNQTHLKV